MNTFLIIGCELTFSMAELTDGREADTSQQHQADAAGINLLQNEHVLENEQPHWVNWWKSIAIGALFALTTLSAAASGDFGSLMTPLILTVGIFGYVYYSREQSQYIVTDQRVLKKLGLIRRSSGETRITDIRSLQTEQGLFERVTGTGSVQIDSTGAGGLLGINGIENHESLANTIRTQQQKLKP